MRRIGQRSFQPRETTGPSVGAFVSREGVVVRPVSEGERPTLPGATMLASDASKVAIMAACQAVAERVKAHALQPIKVTIVS